MKIAVIGGTGMVGSATVAEAAGRVHIDDEDPSARKVVITRDDGEEDVIVPVCGGLVRRGCGCGHEYLVSTWVWERHLSHRQQQQHIHMRTTFLLSSRRPQP